MKTPLAITALLLATAFPSRAQSWSAGIHSGPFVFGDFVERKVRPTVGGVPGEPVTMSLSAATRAGLAIDLERSFAERWAVRLEGAFTRAPLQIQEEGEDALTFNTGEMDVATFMLPVVFRINPRGALRFHLMGGPALAIYEFHPEAHAGSIGVISRTESRWGAAFGGGASWWIRDRFAVEGNLTDIVTSSPFERSDFPDVPGYTIPKPHNVHTTAGVRWRF